MSSRGTLFAFYSNFIEVMLQVTTSLAATGQKNKLLNKVDAEILRWSPTLLILVGI